MGKPQATKNDPLNVLSNSGTEVLTTCDLDQHQQHQSSVSQSSNQNPITCLKEVTKSNQPDLEVIEYITLDLPDNPVVNKHSVSSTKSLSADEFTVCLDQIEQKFNEFTQNLIKTFDCDNPVLQNPDNSIDVKVEVHKSSKSLETITEESSRDIDCDTLTNESIDEAVDENIEVDDDIKPENCNSNDACIGNVKDIEDSVKHNAENLVVNPEDCGEITDKSENYCKLNKTGESNCNNNTSAVISLNGDDNSGKLANNDNAKCLGKNDVLNFLIGNKSPSLTSRTENQSESLDVNVDSSSLCSISDYCQEDYCTQYSDNESEKDIQLDGNNCDQTKGIPKSQSLKDELIEACNKLRDEIDESDEEREVILESKCLTNRTNSLRNSTGRFVEVNGKLKHTNSLVKDLTDSDFSVYESFYSLDNSCTASPIIGRIKKTLTWTPRILSEERFLNSRSTTLSSKASFYTAETSGTFYSARSLQLDSCDNFVTCEDFQKYNEPTNEQKSKLSKAKDALVRGRDFVKSKFDCYRKRLPGLGLASNGNSSENNKKSNKLCHNTCGFSCVSQVSKEISQYSLPDLQSEPKEINSSDNNPSNPNCHDDQHIPHVNNASSNNNDDDDDDVIKLAGDNMAVTMRENGDDDAENDSENFGVNFDDTRHNEKKNNVQKGGKAKENGVSDGQKKAKHESEDKTDGLSRETTDDLDDDLPVGTEAGTMTQKMREAGSGEDARTKKRLRWVSAVERTQGSSSMASNNSSVEQLLHQREMDPELLLNSLGFGGGTFIGDDSLCRIPERFLSQPAMASNQYHHNNYPEFQQALPVMGTSQLLHGANTAMQEPVYENSDEDEMDSDYRPGNHPERFQPRKGSMQRSTFSAIAQGVKFIHGAQVERSPPSPDEETKRICAIPSILDFPNRKALALQGFYGDNYLKDSKLNRENGPMKRSLSAAEKRRKFVHSAKSKNWSLTDENEEEESRNVADSWDRGLMLKSFSDRFSSDSSLESSDSYSNDEQKLVKNNSIKNLRKQYEDTIRQSLDGESPVFYEPSESMDSEKRSISEMRKKQVVRLMTSIDDDGDYVAHPNLPDSLVSSQRGLDPKSVLMQAQKSTQSTITGSPGTPKDLIFSFDQNLKDGENEFDFNRAGTDKSDKLLQNGQQAVSIIIEEDLGQMESHNSGEVIQKSQNSLDLNTLSLGLRSDSCNTLVPVDPMYDSENAEGESTPRSGNISPGLIHQGSRSSDSRDSLKPLQNMVQESFELEEISSGEAINEDFQVQTNKALLHKGPLEKSVSIQSDSSGFADLDPPGETILSGETATIESQLPKTADTTTVEDNVFVCRRSDSCYSENEPIKPSLSSITYAKTEQVVDKSVVFTVNVPIDSPISDNESSISRTSSSSRFVSKVNLHVEASPKNKDTPDKKIITKITRVGKVKYQKINPDGDIENDLDLETEMSAINTDLSRSKGTTLKMSSKGYHRDINMNLPTYHVKDKVQEKIKAKENLITASSNTADWLLESNKCVEQRAASYRFGRPVWASTPNLKYKKSSSGDHHVKRRIRREGTGNHSFDLLLDEEPDTNDSTLFHEERTSGNQLMTQHSSMEQLHKQQQYLDSRGQSEYSSVDESIDQPSLIGSSYGAPDDHVNYLRLARLINGPSLMMDISKMPSAKFTPNFHMKNWMQLPKRKHLEEETLLMQHAVQRYKTELCLMENMLFSLYRTAHPDLTAEERSEVEELQHLWCEVRKEVIKMEELLSERLKAVMSGNDSYSPLDSLEVVQQMIDLLREQLYHQQMCIGRDVNLDDVEDDLDLERPITGSPSAVSSSVSDSWMSEIASQMSDIKSSISTAEVNQKRELQERISELKKGLLTDVRREIIETQNAEMLKLQLQARENEVKRLRMELLLQNVSIGHTRKKQVFESDV